MLRRRTDTPNQAPLALDGSHALALARRKRRPARVGRWLRNWLDLGALGGAYLVTFLPERFDRVMVEASMVGHRTVLRHKTAAVAATMQRLIGDSGTDPAWTDVAFAYRRMRVEAHWLRARSLHRRGSHPAVTVEGLEHLEAARAAGNGVILWRMFFCSSHIPKQALADAGFPLVHLSHWDHGVRGFNTPGMRLFSPLWIRAETRHLVERIVIPTDASMDYLRALRSHLEANRVVSIFGNIRGRAPVAVDVVGTRRLLATGAPSLSWSTGAPLLTMYAVREGPRRFRVVIDRPIAPDRSRGRRAFVEAAVVEYGRRVDERVRRHPESWYRWSIYTDHT